MIVFKLTPDKGFVAGDTETRRAAYAYPSSPHACIANALPERVARSMIESADRAHVDTQECKNYYERLWLLLGD